MSSIDQDLYWYLASGKAEQVISPKYREHVLEIAQKVSDNENAHGVCITGNLPCVISVVFPVVNHE